MEFSHYQLFSVGVAYLLFLFGMAYMTEKGIIPERFTRHPIIFTLSIGVYASAWAVYGVVGFAYQSGYNFLAYFFGISGAFLLAPIMISPILKLVRRYQLTSLADLFAYRYRSQAAGTFAVLVMLFALLPLLALQIQAVSEAVHILTGDSQTHLFASMFVIIIILFTTLFGARHITSREKHPGLVIAIAFETLIKVSAMIIIALYTLFVIFGDLDTLKQWLTVNPQSLAILYDPIEEGPWRTLLLPFFLSALTMPHMYHMIFSESPTPDAIKAASWGLPLIMLLMAITVPIIMWGAIKSGVTTDPEYFTLGLGIASGSPLITLIAFIAGISAASGVMIVVTLSLAIMLLNHWVLPLYQPPSNKDIYHWLLKIRRALIVLILLVSYGFYLMLDGTQDLSELGLVAFVGTIQFAPGLIGVLFWTRATRQGFLAGLFAGFIIWFVSMLLPVLNNSQFLGLLVIDMGYTFTIDNWQVPAMLATFLNTLLFTITSLLTKQAIPEQAAAQTCTLNSWNASYRLSLIATSAEEFIKHLANTLGYQTAKREVTMALNDLAMSKGETRPYALLRLRDQLETNLSGLVGPSVAREIIDENLPYKMESNPAPQDDIHYIESRIEEYQHKLTGLAKELDSLRRFHRQVIDDLPIGVCSLSSKNEILSWNKSLKSITNIECQDVIGIWLWNLQPPWSDLLTDITRAPQGDLFFQRELKLNGRSRYLNIHKALIHVEGSQEQTSNIVIVIEDVTDLRVLEHKIAHNERLAAIGRLAAGVAHEIGNPVTGIACLAQDIQSDLLDADWPDTLKKPVSAMAKQILDQTKRVSTIVQSLVNFSHSGDSQTLQLSPLNIERAVQQSIRLIQLNPARREMTFINQCASCETVSGNEQLLVQVFINLLSNASDASPAGSSIIVRTQDRSDSLHSSQISSHCDNFVTIDIEDEGQGIPTDMLPNVFDPFVTSKPPGKGTGLGLALVYRFIENHGGQISITSPKPNHKKGTIVTIKLPRHP